MRLISTIFSLVFLMIMCGARAEPLTVDPETIVPLPDKFDMQPPAADVPPEIARYEGAWIGTWHDDRHILVVERVTADGRANVVFAQSDSAFYGASRGWWRDEATIVNGVLTLTGFRTFRYAFDGPDRLYMTATLKNGGVTSGTLFPAAGTLTARRRRPTTRMLDVARATRFRNSGCTRTTTNFTPKRSSANIIRRLCRVADTLTSSCSTAFRATVTC